MHNVQALRDRCQFPFEISSAYRCPNHPAEVHKKTTGSHVLGLAIDIQVSGNQAHQLMKEAMRMHGFTGIGVSQKGDHHRRFIHLDVAVGVNRPWIWSY